MNIALNKITSFLDRRHHIAPLVVLRIAFGLVMFAGTLRFWLMGWIDELYVQPVFHFTYYGFDWVKVPGETGVYFLFGLMLISSLMIALGYFYRIASLTFFLLFTYVELIDKTYYLNHYYFISIMSFLLIFVPANRYFSLDIIRKPSLRATHIPAWLIDIFKLQLAILYFHAGVAKLNYDWLINAMPMKTWLPANNNMPIIGSFFNYEWVAYACSWTGAAYDILIPFLLFRSKTRKMAFFFVVVFHMLTWLLFPIGMFPFIMILLTTVFFSVNTHKKILSLIQKPAFILRNNSTSSIPQETDSFFTFRSNIVKKGLVAVFILHLLIQVSLPWRYLLYPGNIFWTEEGYRFSWRVMLMEKAGTTFFYVNDKETGKSGEVGIKKYLTPYQEQMMAFQPDMILQFAHFLADEYKKQGLNNPEIRVKSYVALNGSGSKLFIDPDINLAEQPRGLTHKEWILPFDENKRKDYRQRKLSRINP